MPRKRKDRRSAQIIAERIARRLRDLRGRAALTQEQLAEQVGITSEALGRIERGSGLPSFPTLLKLVGVLGASPNDLLAEGLPEGSSSVPHADAGRPPVETRRLLHVVERLSPGDRRLLLVLARRLPRLRALTPPQTRRAHRGA